jgi:hypothetical protein
MMGLQMKHHLWSCCMEYCFVNECLEEIVISLLVSGSGL